MDQTGKHFNYKIPASRFIFLCKQWARIVLSIEQNLSKKQRIKEKQKYTHLMRNDEKAFIVRWKQTVIYITTALVI